MEITTFIDSIIASKFAVAAICLFWVIMEIRVHEKDKAQHFKERQEWAERIERLTDSLNKTIQFIEFERTRDSSHHHGEN